MNVVISENEKLTLNQSWRHLWTEVTSTSKMRLMRTEMKNLCHKKTFESHFIDIINIINIINIMKNHQNIAQFAIINTILNFKTKKT